MVVIIFYFKSTIRNVIEKKSLECFNAYKFLEIAYTFLEKHSSTLFTTPGFIPAGAARKQVLCIPTAKKQVGYKS
jgi:hypothetical protein